jgi:hypothetical protein
MQQLGLRLLKHHVANIDSDSASVVKEVLEAAPDLNLNLSWISTPIAP